jgi:hypothetical protein
MADMVDRVVGQAHQDPGSPTSPNPSGDEGNAVPNREGGDRFQKRIDELTGQKKWWQERAERMEGEMQELKSEFADLRNTMAAPGGQAPQQGMPSSWQDLSDDNLAQAYSWGGENGNYQAQFQAIGEFIRRNTEKASEKVLERGRQEMTGAQKAAQVQQKVLTEFGDDAASQSSPLWQKANQYAQQLQQQHGQDVLQKMPETYYSCFAMADRDLRSGEREELQTLRQEMQKVKEAQATEPGSIGAVRLGTESANALKDGNIKGAIQSLGIVKSFGG